MVFWLTVALLEINTGSPPVDFDTQVMPILTKAGCNAGTCHGAAAGRGDFFLSLYGSRPESDYNEIARAMRGRRINLRQPALSLLLQKPTEQLGHEGGTRLELDGLEHNLIQRWISEGAKRSAGRKLQSLSFTVDRKHVAKGESVRFRSVADFGNGPESVLKWTVIRADDPSAVDIRTDGVATVNRPGRHIICGRFLDRIATVELLIPFGDTKVPTSAAPNDATPSIDNFVDQRLHQLQISTVSAAKDRALIRRLSLDLTGRLPGVARVDAFASSQRPGKFAVLVDELLQSQAHVEYWAFLIARQLRAGNKAAAPAYYTWIRQCVAEDLPFDKFTRQLLTATGRTKNVGPASFYAISGGARETAEFVSRTFLGVRLECANCHDHPLDSWTQDDYHGLAAVFARVKKGPEIRIGFGEVIHPVTGEPAVAKIPGGKRLSEAGDERQDLADWLISPQNTLFAQAFVNRVWHQLMGRGLVEPVDDLRVTNPSTHPKLLTWLANEFSANGFRIRKLIRQICLSRAYQRASLPESTDESVGVFYGAANPKIISREVYLDAVTQVIGHRDPSMSPIQHISHAGLVSVDNETAKLSACAVDNCIDTSLAKTDLAVQLKLLNGDLLNGRLRNSDQALLQTTDPVVPVTEFVTRFYHIAYSRNPSIAELNFWARQFPEPTNRKKFREVAEDFVWSLLTSDEFYTNN